MKRPSNSSSSLSVASDPPLPVLTAVDPLLEASPTQPPPYRQIKLALLITARRTGLDPVAGLTDVLWHIPQATNPTVAELLPWNWELAKG